MIILCEFTEDFLNKSWFWLNEPDIKKKTNTPDFTREEQIKWFRNLKNISGYYIWGLKVNDIPIGACGLKKVTRTDAEYWGYIGEKEFWSKGLGQQMMLYMMNEAIKLGLSSIWLQVNNDNYRAVKLYKKTGFSTESEIGNMIFMRKYL